MDSDRANQSPNDEVEVEASWSDVREVHCWMCVYERIYECVCMSMIVCLSIILCMSMLCV